MAETQGMVQPNLDADRDGAMKIKPQIHRAGLSYRTEGLWFKANKQNPVRTTDYSPRNWSTTVKTAANAGDTVIYVNSVKGFGRYREVYFDRSGAGEEHHYITSIDVVNKTITLQEGLTNNQAVGKIVDMDRVIITNTDGKTAQIDFVFTGQNSNSALAGADVQHASAKVRKSIGWKDGDRFDAEVRVSYAVGASVQGVVMVDECYEVEGDEEDITDSHESASAVDPNYFLRIKFISSEDVPTEKTIRLKIGLWRA